MHRAILFSILLFSMTSAASLAEEPSATAAETPRSNAPQKAAEGAEDSNAVEASIEEHAAVESEVEKYFRRQGYVPVKKDGRTLYCRDEAALGTRLKKQVCITEEIARQRREDARREMEEKFGDRMWKEGMLAPSMPPVR